MNTTRNFKREECACRPLSAPTRLRHKTVEMPARKHDNLPL
jgi:hypothetical protein